MANAQKNCGGDGMMIETLFVMNMSRINQFVRFLVFAGDTLIKDPLWTLWGNFDELQLQSLPGVLPVRACSAF